MIGDTIEITIVDIRGDKVRLGITAPREVSVHRKEVYEAIRRENRQAAQPKTEDIPNVPAKPAPPQEPKPLPSPSPPADDSQSLGHCPR
jgi:carbon storage regulator